MDVRVVRMGRGYVIAAIQEERRAGTTHLFMMRRDGARFRITSRQPLDAGDFRNAEWKVENVDADGDGYEEAVCTGTNPRLPATGTRIVLYVPRTRETYTLRLDGNGSKRLRATWSPNALSRKGAPYRAALQQRARTLIGSF